MRRALWRESLGSSRLEVLRAPREPLALKVDTWPALGLKLGSGLSWSPLGLNLVSARAALSWALGFELSRWRGEGSGSQKALTALWGCCARVARLGRCFP